MRSTELLDVHALSMYIFKYMSAPDHVLRHINNILLDNGVEMDSPGATSPKGDLASHCIVIGCDLNQPVLPPRGV